MAGYVVIKSGSEITLKDLESLVAKARNLKVPQTTGVHFGFLNGEMVLAVPATVTRKTIPPVPRKETKQPMRGAKRRGRQ